MFDRSFKYTLPYPVKIKPEEAITELAFYPISWAKEDDKLKIRRLFLEGKTKFQMDAIGSNPFLKNLDTPEKLQKFISKVAPKETPSEAEQEQLDNISNREALINTDYKTIAEILFSNGYIKVCLSRMTEQSIELTLNAQDLITFMDNLKESDRLDILAGWVKIFLS